GRNRLSHHGVGLHRSPCKRTLPSLGKVTGSQKPNSLRSRSLLNACATDMQLSDATIVFDIDGTLVDTAPDLAAATNHALAGAGLKPLSVAELRPFIGYGSRVMLDAGLRHHGLSVREPELSGLHERFFTFYADHVAVSSRPYDGVRELLEALRRAGARLAVCTNKYEHLSKALLRQLDLEPMFGTIAGRDTFAMCKPDPGHLTAT